MRAGARHGDDAAHEAEVREVVRVDARRRVDLQCVVVRARVLEQTIVRVHELVRQPVEPLAARATSNAMQSNQRGTHEQQSPQPQPQR